MRGCSRRSGPSRTERSGGTGADAEAGRSMLMPPPSSGPRRADPGRTGPRRRTPAPPGRPGPGRRRPAGRRSHGRSPTPQAMPVSRLNQACTSGIGRADARTRPRSWPRGRTRPAGRPGSIWRQQGSVTLSGRPMRSVLGGHFARARHARSSSSAAAAAATGPAPDAWAASRKPSRTSTSRGCSHSVAGSAANLSRQRRTAAAGTEPPPPPRRRPPSARRRPSEPSRSKPLPRGPSTHSRSPAPQTAQFAGARPDGRDEERDRLPVLLGDRQRPAEEAARSRSACSRANCPGRAPGQPGTCTVSHHQAAERPVLGHYGQRAAREGAAAGPRRLPAASRMGPRAVTVRSPRARRSRWRPAGCAGPAGRPP